MAGSTTVLDRLTAPTSKVMYGLALPPGAELIRVVLDNRNTHTPAALYAAFPAPEARRLARKLEFHHTPKHGSWLNAAERELAVLATQCLDRRLPDLATVAREVRAWGLRRNRERPTVT